MSKKTASKTSSSNPNKKNKKELTIEEFITKEYPPYKDETLDIRFLWGNNYRLNYWIKNEKNDNINRSIFVLVKKTVKGLKATIKK